MLKAGDMARACIARSGSQPVTNFEIRDRRLIAMLEPGTSGTLAAYICVQLLHHRQNGAAASDLPKMELLASVPQVRSIRLAILAQITRDWLYALDPVRFHRQYFDCAESDDEIFEDEQSDHASDLNQSESMQVEQQSPTMNESHGDSAQKASTHPSPIAFAISLVCIFFHSYFWTD